MEARRCRCHYQGGLIPCHRQRREDAATCLRRSRCMPPSLMPPSLSCTCLRRDWASKHSQGGSPRGRPEGHGDAGGCQQHSIRREVCENISLPSSTVIKRNRNASVHTHSEDEAAMVDGGIKVQMPISRPAHSRPPSAPGGCGNLPAPQSMHAAELDAPVAELYVPAVEGGK
jgi:hypothetical protein